MNRKTEEKSTRLVYLRTPEAAKLVNIANKLSEEHVPRECMHIYSSDPGKSSSSPVKISRYRSPRISMVLGIVAGLIVGMLVGIPLLALGGLGVAPLLVVMVAGGVVGAVYTLWIGGGPGGELYRLEDAIKKGETVMVIETDDDRVSDVLNKINTWHPDVLVLGTDPVGSPPFP